MSVQVLSKKECAARIGIDTRSLDRLDAAGHGPPRLQISERRVGFLESDLAAWLETRRRPQPQHQLPLPAPADASSKAEGE